MTTLLTRAFFPIKVLPTQDARRLLQSETATAAVLALRAILAQNKGLEIAHQQIVFRGLHLAFSSRITDRGDIVLDLDVGDPKLAGRIVLEEELRRAVRKVRGINP